MRKCVLRFGVCAVVLAIAGSASAETIEVMAMGGFPVAPMDTSESIVTVLPQSAVVLSDVPTSRWYHGCSATSAGMIFGYYDRIGYSNMYTGSINGGVAPLYDLGHTTHLVASKQGVDGYTARGHVDDYWISYQSTGPDPWEGNWTEHTWADCTADFMGTNQWKWDFIGNDGVKDFNTDGSTALFSYTNSPAKLYDHIPAAGAGLPQTALAHGLRLFAESRGYSVSHDGTNYQNYTQKTDNQVTGGFGFADFRAEIDAGRPVMIQVTGHSMVGMGYDAASNLVYLHDTWDNNVHSMTWGTSYSGMDLQAITVLQLGPLDSPVPAPSALVGLVGLGLMGLVFARRRRNRRPRA